MSILPYGKQDIDEEDIQAVVEVLKTDFLTTGPRVREFEEKLCQLTGAEHAVAVANGTVALHLACIVAGLSEGECAIVPSLTFLATANAVRYCGADVVFADVDPQTGLLTVETLKAALEKADHKGFNARAVLPVHLAGQPVDLEKIRKVSDEHGLTVIADSCHALGTEYDGKPLGAGVYEDMACFSFHPVKTIAMGEGGAITTNNKAMAERMRSLRHHGISPTPEVGPWAYEMCELGYNFRLTDIQCALGVSQLSKLDKFLSRRREIVSRYDEAFKRFAPIVQGSKHVTDPKSVGWHLYALRIDFEALGLTRVAVMTELKERGVGTQVHYIPVHTQPYYVDLYGAEELPGAQHYYEHTLSIPLYPSLTDDNVEQVIKAFEDIVG